LKEDIYTNPPYLAFGLCLLDPKDPEKIRSYKDALIGPHFLELGTPHGTPAES
jgi:hypothetical protein